MKYTSLSVLLFVSLAQGDKCTHGYVQAPNGGACYLVNVYYDSFIPGYTPQTFDGVNVKCENNGYGFLTSIHSKEENEYVYSLKDTISLCASNSMNIGIKCTGKKCSWYDGSPVTYTNFYEEPKDDGAIRCYGITGNEKLQWIKMACKQEQGYVNNACWVCKQPNDCFDYEIASNGGCVSVYSWPLDQQNAEAVCPTGGHLVSIHNDDENTNYKQLALAASINGTIYIGGQLKNGQFEWIDGTNYDDSTHWAKGFPNEILGSCVQMMLDSNFGVQGLWSNVDCSVKQPYICLRNADFPVLSPPSAPKSDERCPPIQNFTGSGIFYSPNYPASIPSQQTCEYILEAAKGLKASVIFHKFDCQSGTSLTLYDGDDAKPFVHYKFSFSSAGVYCDIQYYQAQSFTFQMIFTIDGSDEPIGTGWEAEFTGK